MVRIFLLALMLGMFPLLDARAQSMQAGNTNLVAAPKSVELKVPNAFTPNGDGRNDVFKLVNIHDERLIDFRIFNRWGTILYRSTDNDANQGWDGSYKGEAQPNGVYGYLIRIAYPDGNIETYKGTVTLLR